MFESRKKAIIAGSSASLPRNIRTAEKDGIFEVPFIIRPDDNAKLQFIDNADVSTQDRNIFIDYTRSRDHQVKTSQPNPADYLKKLESAVEWGAEDIIIPSVLSPALSGAYNSLNTALDMFKNTSDVPVYLPTRFTKVSVAEGMDVIKAINLRNNGLSSQEIINTINDEYFNCEMSQVLSDLEPLRKAGRIGRAATLAAGVLNIRAILSLDLEKGELYGINKKRGFEKYTQAAIDHIKLKMGQTAVKLAFIYFEPNEVNLDKFIDKSCDQLNVVGDVIIGEQSYVISSYTSVDTVGVYAEKIKV